MTQKANQTPAGRDSLLMKAIGVLLNNWPLKLLSLVIALGLWAGLITQDPTVMREKVFRDVSVSVINEDIFKRNGYIVTSDLDELLSGVDVVVEVPQMQYAEAQPSNYNIRVDLNRLERRAGEQELTIFHTSSNAYGSVTRVNPASITVMVEEYATSDSIPVNVVQLGEAPEGYYAVGVSCDPTWITVSGPRSLVERVVRAEVVLDMAQLPAREGHVENALSFTLVDENGQSVESEHLQVTREGVLRERVNVSVTLYAKRDIDLLTAQLYVGRPAEGYEVTDVYITPDYVTVAGQKSVVDSVNLLQTARLVNINGATDTVTETVDLARPLNLQWISATKVSVTVVIQPKKDTIRTEDVPVNIAGVPEGWSAQADRTSAVVHITGDARWLDGVATDAITLWCDVAGLPAGVHELPLMCRINGSEGQNFLVEIEPPLVQVTLTEAAAEPQAQTDGAQQ